MPDILTVLASLNLLVNVAAILCIKLMWRFLEKEMPRRRRKAKLKEGDS